MSRLSILPRVLALDPYVPGLSIAEIQAKYGLSQVIKLASNENPLGASPLAQEAIRNAAASAFRYPAGGNPRLREAIGQLHDVSPDCVILGNGSDEILDLLIRILAEPGLHNCVCFQPCFSIYPLQAHIAGVETRRAPLKPDFSFDLDALAQLVDDNTRLLFLTTPDNPTGYCPPRERIEKFAADLATKAPQALIVLDEAYMDFADNEQESSLLASHRLPANVAICRTFSKSWGLAGARLGYAILPLELADAFWRVRLPFSVNLLAEEGALAALGDSAFRDATLTAVKDGRVFLKDGLEALGCVVWPSSANFLMFRPPQGVSAEDCFERLLRAGIIIRPLKSYGLAEYLRVSVGTMRENRMFLAALSAIIERKAE